MADTVAYIMEAMIPELEDFETRGLFTRAEIKRIVAQRTAHEYAMKRRATDKADFLRAIEARPPGHSTSGSHRQRASPDARLRLLRVSCAPQQYEEQLETLRRHRKKVQNAAQPAAEETEPPSGGRTQGGRRGRAPHAASGAGDHALVQRIHFLYTRALRKFRGDLRLWVRCVSLLLCCPCFPRPLTVFPSLPPLASLGPPVCVLSGAWRQQGAVKVPGLCSGPAPDTRRAVGLRRVLGAPWPAGPALGAHAHAARPAGVPAEHRPMG